MNRIVSEFYIKHDGKITSNSYPLSIIQSLSFYYSISIKINTKLSNYLQSTNLTKSLAIIIDSMYIDSPNFVKRKVLNLHNNQPHIPQQYRLGNERQALSDHVQKQLNQHDQDADILQKFRREAQELKRQRFLAKKNRSLPPEQGLLHSDIKHDSNKNSSSMVQKPVQSRLRVLSKVSEPTNPQHEQPVSLRRAIKDDELLYHYQKIIKSKDKELKRKQKKLQKSKVVIEQLGDKIEHLKQERRLLHKNEELEMMKINTIIEEMNFKIAQNKAAFREELARLKFQLLEPSQTVSIKKATNRRDLSIPILPKDKKIERIYDSQRLLQGPSIYYQPLSLQTIDLVQSRIDTNLQSVGKGLGKMKKNQKILQTQFQKYKQL